MEAVEKLRIDFANARDHLADDLARFGGGIGRGVHLPQTMENDSRNGVHHGGEGCDGKDVAGHFDGAFLRGAFNSLNPLGMRQATDVPDIAEDVASVSGQEVAELAIAVPSARDGTAVNRAFDVTKRFGRCGNVGLGAVEPDVALALLYGIVKRMSMKKRPDELTTNIFETEFKVGMLKNGVVAAVKCGSANVDALLLGDFAVVNDVRRIARSSRGHRRIERMRERIAKGYPRGASFHDGICGADFRCSWLGGHLGKHFTRGLRKTYTLISSR